MLGGRAVDVGPQLLGALLAVAHVVQFGLQLQHLSAHGGPLPTGLALRQAQRAQLQLGEPCAAFAAHLRPAAFARGLGLHAAAARLEGGQGRQQAAHRAQRGQAGGGQFHAPAVALAFAHGVAAAFQAQAVAAQLKLGLQAGRRPARCPCRRCRPCRTAVTQLHIGRQRHAGEHGFLQTQRAVAGHALGQRQGLQVLGAARQAHVELPGARQAVRPLPPCAAGFARPPGHGVEVVHAAGGAELPVAARLALQPGGERGAGGTGLRGGAAQFQQVVVGAAFHLQLHGLRRAGQAALQVELPAHGGFQGRRAGAAGLRVGRGQAAEVQRHRAGQRHGGGAAVQALRGHALQARFHRERMRLP
ncbi:hypothetical protein D621_13130 [beta proteobacterium AAP51]|nr:hypothetical protein D621_13130 [beta proteobacterium AAP51]